MNCFGVDGIVCSEKRQNWELCNYEKLEIGTRLAWEES